MTDYLLIPIHVEALFLPGSKKTPASIPDRKNALNPKPGNRPDSFEPILSSAQHEEPYQKPGVHLHWFLPFALTRGMENKEKGTIEFPVVPNRWLITRQDRSGAKKQWVVESDYLHPEGKGEDQVVFPSPKIEGAQAVSSPPTNETSARRIGRNISLADWLTNEKIKLQGGVKDKYLDQWTRQGLTAIGYGVPTFATLYPQCHSVFGFYDDEIKDLFPNGLKYTVIGWYSKPTDDFLKKYLAQSNLLTEGQQVAEVLKRNLNWSLPGNPTREELQRMFCYGVVSEPLLDFKPSAKKVAVANSGMEALSAYLADELAGGQNNQKTLIEEQLDFLFVQSKLDEDPQNPEMKFQESRHESGFNPVYGGSQWTIQPNISPTPSSNQPQEKIKVRLSPEMARQLSELNRKQRDHDRATQEITDKQQQLSSDWHNHRLNTLPAKGMGMNISFAEQAGKFTQTQETQSLNNEIVNSLRASQIVQGEIQSRQRELKKAIGQSDHPEEKGPYTLKEIPAARYWQPKEPVVLIAGEDEPAFVKNMGNMLDCKLVQVIDIDQTVTQPVLDKILAETAGLQTAEDSLPWPVLLEWEVAFFSLRSEESAKGNIEPHRMGVVPDSPARLYPNEFITSNFEFGEKKVEIRRKATIGGPQNLKSLVRGGVRPEAGTRLPKPEQIYRGSGVLTPHAGKRLKQGIVKYLQAVIGKDKFVIPIPSKGVQGGRAQISGAKVWYDRLREDQTDTAGENSFEQRLSKSIDEIHQAYESRLKTVSGESVQPGQPDAVSTFLRAFRALQNETFLAQPLSGFNDQLVHRETAPFSAIDPMFSSPPARNDTASGPQSPSEFNPIRAGTLKLLSLRLVDTFGRTKEVPCSPLIVDEQMRDPAGEQDQIALPPRLAQPARLNFRWLAAASSLQELREMNVDAATQPICGWLLPNFLENSLMVYDQTGTALGQVAAKPNVSWQVAPGSSTAQVDDIANPHLKKVIAHLCGSQNSKAFLDGFIQNVEKALENIAPVHSDGPVELAQLLGRPVAVVRASLQFEVFGLPAVPREGNAPRQQPGRAAQGGHTFGGVRIPVRLGQDERLSDGLIGYWTENQQGAFEASYQPSQTSIELAVDDPPKTLTLLLNPHGKIHAACGILPVKAIDIPAEQYADSLQNLGMTFLVAPMLTDQNEIKLPIQPEPGQNWTWLDKQEGVWKETSLPSSQGAFAAPQEIREVWLKLTPEENISNMNLKNED